MSERKKFGYGVSAITAEQIKNVDHLPEHKTIMWHGMKLAVRPLLDIEEVSQIVDGVLSACFDDVRQIFFPELLDFATRASIITHYANVVLPDSIQEQYRAVYATDLYDSVVAEVVCGQIESIVNAIHLCVAHMVPGSTSK